MCAHGERGTAWVHGQLFQGRGKARGLYKVGRSCCRPFTSAFGLVFVPCLPSFSESQLSSGSLPKISSHIHLRFKQRSVSSLPEKMIPQPRCPGNLCVEPHAFPF